MMLYETMMVDCIMMDKLSVPDGMGGFNPSWTEGAPFRAAIVKLDTSNVKIAEKQGMSEMFKVTVKRGIQLDFHDVFKRVEDGAIFRVTSRTKDSESPKVASFQMGQVDAERWELP